jgi:hypothetical protein
MSFFGTLIDQSGRSNTESLNDTIPEILSDSEPLNFNIAINRAGRDVAALLRSSYGHSERWAL